MAWACSSALPARARPIAAAAPQHQQQQEHAPGTPHRAHVADAAATGGGSSRGSGRELQRLHLHAPLLAPASRRRASRGGWREGLAQLFRRLWVFARLPPRLPLPPSLPAHKQRRAHTTHEHKRGRRGPHHAAHPTRQRGAVVGLGSCCSGRHDCWVGCACHGGVGKCVGGIAGWGLGERVDGRAGGQPTGAEVWPVAQQAWCA